MHFADTLLGVFFLKKIILCFVLLFVTKVRKHEMSNILLDCSPLLVYYGSVGFAFATVMVSSKLVETIKKQ